MPDTSHLDWMPIRHLRINFHVMNSADSSKVVSEEIGRRGVLELLVAANADLDTNIRNWRSPEGTPTLPRRYRYQLTSQGPNDDGIYFHYDDNLYYYVVSGKNQNNYNRKAIDKYGIGLDSIINVFIQVHHPDSLKSKTYHGSGQAIALGTDVKLSGIFELGHPPKEFRGMFNHEIGHVLSLGHAWVEDGCPDTNNHPNHCYEWTLEPPCNDHATNNMMDYNAYEIAVTPCQIGRMHSIMSAEGNRARAIVINDWCEKTGEPIAIREKAKWSGSKDLQNDIIIEAGGDLTLAARLSLPEGAQILVKAGGTLRLDGCRLHNSCDRPWKGIILEKSSKGALAKVEVIAPYALENVEN